MNDELIEGGVNNVMTNGKDYREVRQFRSCHNLIRFYFITCSYSHYVETILTDLYTSVCPDVVIVNSCLWDLTR